MRQVPPDAHSPLGIVGDGRVARHFLHYFTLLGLRTSTWSRRCTRTPDEALAGCATVLLLISDRAIPGFADAWPELRQKRLVHCSGALVTPGITAAHPLTTFGDELYDLATYRRIPFVLDGGSPPLEQVLPGVPNPWFTIPAAARPRYHALCVMAGNFSTLLWTKLFDEFDARFGIPASAAIPYLEQTAANLAHDRHRALTGPLVRGDQATIDANLAALEGDPFQAVYAAFVRAYAVGH